MSKIMRATQNWWTIVKIHFLEALGQILALNKHLHFHLNIHLCSIKQVIVLAIHLDLLFDGQIFRLYDLHLKRLLFAHHVCEYHVGFLYCVASS